MKLASLKTSNGIRVVAVNQRDGETQFIDLKAIDESLPLSLKALLAQEDGLARAAAAAGQESAGEHVVTGQLVAPIIAPGKVICIGLNYRDHAIETGAEIPTEPICFSKFSHTVVGPGADIQLPTVAKQVDYECELVMVIGRRGKNIAAADARSYIAGYTNGNDVSARDWQIGRPGGQWLIGKTPDTFAPTGPWLVTSDEISNPNELGIRLRLNGETLQDSNTREFIFTVEQVIEHISQLITLEPGDIIFTGTPPGVGLARTPQIFLKPGDDVEVEIDEIGILRNPVVAEG